MEFGILKCAVLSLQRRKKTRWEGIQLPNGEEIGEDSPQWKNLFLALNTWAITVIRYSAAFLDWTKEEIKELDRWTRKQLIAGRALHAKSNVMRLYIKRKYVGRGLINVEECCAAELRSIDFYLANSVEELLKVVARLEKLGKDKIESKKYYNNRIEQEKMDQLRSMKLHGQFERDTDDKKSEKSWHWFRNRNLKRETERKLVVSNTGASLKH